MNLNYPSVITTAAVKILHNQQEPARAQCILKVKKVQLHGIEESQKSRYCEESH